MEWFRWYGGTAGDPKLQWVARRSRQSVAAVVAVWVAVLERANGHETRGCCSGMDLESLDVSLGLDDGAAESIYLAMVDKGMITDDGTVVAWEKRQPKREDMNAAERQRNKREKDRLQKENDELRARLAALESAVVTKGSQNHTESHTVTDVTQCHAESHTVTDVTQCHAASRTVTLEEKREEERKEEKPTATTTARATVTQQFEECFQEHEQKLRQLFPHADYPAERELCIAHYRDGPVHLDPWVVVLKWFNRIKKTDGGGNGNGTGRAGRSGTAAGKTPGVTPANGPDADWLGGSQFTPAPYSVPPD